MYTVDKMRSHGQNIVYWCGITVSRRVVLEMEGSESFRKAVGLLVKNLEV